MQSSVSLLVVLLLGLVGAAFLLRLLLLPENTMIKLIKYDRSQKWCKALSPTNFSGNSVSYSNKGFNLVHRENANNVHTTNKLSLPSLSLSLFQLSHPLPQLCKTIKNKVHKTKSLLIKICNSLIFCGHTA